MKTRKLVYGVGINDADYEVTRYEYVIICYSVVTPLNSKSAVQLTLGAQ